MPLGIPVALITIDNVAHELTRLALRDSLEQVNPEQVLILTDAPERIAIAGADYAPFDGDYIGVMRALWYDVPPLLRADHFIWIQWDSWVLDAAQWRSEYLDYDYIGAPWPVVPGNSWARLGYTRDRNVGNGGFSLRSFGLARYIASNPEQFPLCLPEDDGLCRKYRPRLENLGFRWAPTQLASQFSVEIGEWRGDTFGYHNCWHWQQFLDPGRLRERLQAASPFVRQHLAMVKLEELLAA